MSFANIIVFIETIIARKVILPVGGFLGYYAVEIVLTVIINYIANKLYYALDAQIKSGENLQVKGAYKKGYGQSMPQNQPQGNGMGSSRRDTSWDPNGFGSGAAM